MRLECPPGRLLYSLPVTATTPAKGDKRSVLLISLLILIIAFAIRLPGIGWGLKNDLHNESYHPDEPVIFDFAHQTGFFHPPTFRQYYNYGTLYYFILRTADTVGQTVGAVHKPETLDATIDSDPKKWDELTTYVSEADLWGRLAGALAGAATAMLIFLILRRWTTLLGALSGAALIAIAPAHVEHSRFQTVDIVSLFFVALTTLLCVRLLRPDLDDTKSWIGEVLIASMLIGFSASTRYTNALLIFPLWVALAVRRPKNWPTFLALAPIVAFASFVATTPGFVTDSDYFWQNFNYQVGHAQGGHDLIFVGRPSGFLYHIYELVIGISLLGVAVGILGLLVAAFRKNAWAWVVLAFFIPYYISIGRLDTMFLRYGFPLYVGVACGFGYAIHAIQRKGNKGWLAAAVAALCLVGVENAQAGIRGTYLFTKWMTGTDPRDAAGKYLKDQAGQNGNIDVGILGSGPWFFSAAMTKDSPVIYFQPRDVQAALLAQTSLPHVESFMQGGNPVFATYTSYEVEDGLRLKDRTDLDMDSMSSVHLVNEQKSILDDRYRLVQTFGGDGPTIHDLEYIQPTIWVLKRKDLP
jgi:hypothetical protein